MRENDHRFDNCLNYLLKYKDKNKNKTIKYNEEY